MAKNYADKTTVPADAVGKATVETTQPDGATTVKTVPASEVKAQTAPAPPTPAVPRRATRQTRDQRQRTRQAAQAKRQQARQRPRQRAPEPLGRTQRAEEERSVTIALTPRQWAIIDRQLERTGQDTATWFRRFLAPHLRG